MERRHFSKLLVLFPAALLLPAQRRPYLFRCLTCNKVLGHLERPAIILKEGQSWCVDHASHHPLSEPGKGLITGFTIGREPDGVLRLSPA